MLRHYGWTVTPTGCWEFSGPRHKQGYGAVVLGGKTVRTSRLAFRLWRGPLAEADHVLHSCDNPPCINPAHLFIGRQPENNADMIAKGRNKLPPVLSGARAPWARLTATQAATIKTRHAQGVSQAQLGREFGVSSSTIWKLVAGKSYKEEK